MDLETDLSEESGGFSPKDAKDYPELTKRIYDVSMSTAQLEGISSSQNNQGRMYLFYNVGSFVGRSIVTRQISFSETFAQIGGAWSTSAIHMISGIFLSAMRPQWEMPLAGFFKQG